MPSTFTELSAPSQYFPNVQTVEDNIFISHGQDMDIINARPSLESLAILYNDN